MTPEDHEWEEKQWEDPFLRCYVEWGNIDKACKKAGVSRERFRKRRKESADFLAQFHNAKRAFMEGLEEDLVRLGRDHRNVIAIIARLKAENPRKYHEKLQVEGKMLQYQITIPPDEAKVFFQEMIRHAQPETLKMLTDGDGHSDLQPNNA